MTNSIIETYLAYESKIGNRKDLYSVIAKEFDIYSAVYPGSHIDIAPSMVIPRVTYIDNFKGAIRFFKNMDIIKAFLQQKKEYEGSCDIIFYGQDYTEPINIEEVDLIISQYAGFVGQATKHLLKVGGILLCNDSHGDATLAKFDKDFEFIGIVDRKNKIQRDNLENYFTLPANKPIDVNTVKAKMKGLRYSQNAENYLFRKIN